MEFHAFLESCIGTWFSQRTSYNFHNNNAESKKSEVIMESVSPDDPSLQGIYQASTLTPSSSLSGIKMNWESSGDWGAPKQKGAAVWLFVPSEESRLKGQLFRQLLTPQPGLLTGRYLLGADESLTLILESDSLYSEERIWFASNNLRLRTSLIKNGDRFSHSAFYSEIRKLPPSA
ncbi:MAG: phycobiliprotein lyase [Snowella sp.]|nr:phycobiliprotein lyase [Snowella sp.]